MEPPTVLFSNVENSTLMLSDPLHTFPGQTVPLPYLLLLASARELGKVMRVLMSQHCKEHAGAGKVDRQQRWWQ